MGKTRSRNHYAALDIGSNSFHMIVAELTKKDQLHILTRRKEIVRLAEHESLHPGIIPPEKIDYAIQVICRMRTSWSFYFPLVKIVATSAVRDAKNSDEFVRAVKERCGLDIEVLSGEREAELIFKGVLHYFPPSEESFLSVDLGGGSTEFVYGNINKMDYVASINLGAVRLTKKYFPDYLITYDRLFEARKEIDRLLDPVIEELSNFNTKKMVASSGTAYSLFNLVKAAMSYTRKDHARFFTRENFLKVRDEVLFARTKEERLRIPGMEPKRADIIMSGVLIYDRIIERLNISEVYYSDYSLREGVIFEMIENRMAEERNQTSVNNIKPSKKERYSMSYHNSKIVDMEFSAVIEKATEELKKEGFGVLTEIDVKETLKKKLDVDFRKYKILGACNPPFAYKALSSEESIGVLLPCNVVVQETEPGKQCKVSVVNPMTSMQAVNNPDLASIAVEVSEKLNRVLAGI